MVRFTRSKETSNITTGNYVVATKTINSIQKRSVGLVKSISGKDIAVFFIGANMTVNTDSNHVTYLDVKKTGKPYKKKICNICHLLKSMKEFDVNQTDAKGRKTTRPSCQICRVAIDGKPLKPTEKKRLNSTISKASRS